MGKMSVVAVLGAMLGLASVGPAFANGGMGDAAAFTRANNERCEAQRRGEYPRYFNACLPDYPVTDYGVDPSTARRPRGHGGMN